LQARERDFLPAFREVLDNGLTVLFQELPAASSMAVMMNVTTGSRDEAVEEMGMSHLVEHMLFQGTKHRDTRELSRVINAVGGHLDACTGRESTSFYTKVPIKHFGLAMDVLADMIANPCLHQANLEKEKRVILEEIHMYEDTPDELVHDLFAQALWPRHPLGRPILGTRSRLAKVGRPELLDFVRRHYQPARMMLAIAGGASLKSVKAMARKYFGGLTGQGQCAQDGPAVPAPAFKHLVTHRELEQTHVCLGVRGIPYSDPRRYAALAFSNILGGGTNSRLFYEVRERRALTYSIYSFMDFYRDTGVAGLYVACHPQKLKETLKVIRQEIYRMATRPVSDREFSDVREQMRGSLLLSLESTSSHIWHMIQQESYLHEHPTVDTILREIQRITKSDILSVAREIFLDVPTASAILGPVKNHPYPDFSLKA
jgi:predicted Zn-dependent peptidase